MSIECMPTKEKRMQKRNKDVPPYTMFDTFHMFARGMFAHTSQGRKKTWAWLEPNQ